MSAQKRQKSSSESKQDNSPSTDSAQVAQASSESTIFNKLSDRQFDQLCHSAINPNRNKRSVLDEENNNNSQLRNGEGLTPLQSDSDAHSFLARELELQKLRRNADDEILKEERLIDAKFSDKIYRQQSTSNSYHQVPLFTPNSQTGRPKSLPPGPISADYHGMTSPSYHQPPLSTAPLHQYSPATANYGTMQYSSVAYGNLPNMGIQTDNRNHQIGPHRPGTYQQQGPQAYHQRQLSASAIMTSSVGQVPVDQSVTLPLGSDSECFLTKNEDVPHLVDQLVREKKVNPNGSSPYLRSSSRSSDNKSIAIDLDTGSGSSSVAAENFPYIDDTGSGGNGWLPTVGTAALTGIGDPPPPIQETHSSLETGDIRAVQNDSAIVFSGAKYPHQNVSNYYSRGNEEIELQSLGSHENSPQPQQNARINGLDLGNSRRRGGMSPEDTASEPGQGTGDKKKSKGRQKAANQRKGAYDLTNQLQASFGGNLYGDSALYGVDHLGFGVNKRTGGSHSPPLEPTYRNLGIVPASGQRKKKAIRQGGVKKELKAEQIEGHKGDLSVEAALEFVEGKKLNSEEQRKQQKNNKTPSKKSNGGGKNENSGSPPETRSEEEKEEGTEEPVVESSPTEKGRKRNSKDMTGGASELTKEQQRRREEKARLDLTDPRLYASDSFVKRIEQNPEVLEQLPAPPASATGTRKDTDEEFVPVVTKKSKKKVVTGRSSLGPTPRSMTPPLSQPPSSAIWTRTRRRSNEMLPVGASGNVNCPSASNARAPSAERPSTTQTAPNLEDLENFPGIPEAAKSSVEYPGLGAPLSDNSKAQSLSDPSDKGDSSLPVSSTGGKTESGAVLLPAKMSYAKALLPVENRIVPAYSVWGSGKAGGTPKMVGSTKISPPKDTIKSENDPPIPSSENAGTVFVSTVSGPITVASADPDVAVETLKETAEESKLQKSSRGGNCGGDSTVEDAVMSAPKEVGDDSATVEVEQAAVNDSGTETIPEESAAKSDEGSSPDGQKAEGSESAIAKSSSSGSLSARKKVSGGGVFFEDIQFEEEPADESGMYEFGDFSDVEGSASDEDSAKEEEKSMNVLAEGARPEDPKRQEEVTKTEKHEKLIRHFNKTWKSNSKNAVKYQFAGPE